MTVSIAPTAVHPEPWQYCWTCGSTAGGVQCPECEARERAEKRAARIAVLAEIKRATKRMSPKDRADSIDRDGRLPLERLSDSEYWVPSNSEADLTHTVRRATLSDGRVSWSCDCPSRVPCTHEYRVANAETQRNAALTRYEQATGLDPVMTPVSMSFDDWRESRGQAWEPIA